MGRPCYLAKLGPNGNCLGGTVRYWQSPILSRLGLRLSLCSHSAFAPYFVASITTVWGQISLSPSRVEITALARLLFSAMLDTS